MVPSQHEASSAPDPVGFTIQTYVPFGEPAGLKLIERDNWSGVLLDFSATKGQGEALKREETGRSGVYLLSDEGAQTAGISRLYIGESDVLRGRLPKSMGEKKWWNRAVVCTAKDDSLTKAHALHLETRLIALGKKAGQADIEQNDTHSLLKGAARDVAERYLQNLLDILPFIGISAFEIPSSESTDPEDRLLLDARGAKAYARETGDGFVVEKGSIARADEANSIPDYFRARRKKLIEAGDLVPEGQGLVMTKDFIFPSSSTAAAVMAGASMSGPDSWRDSQGRTINQRQADLVELEGGSYSDDE